MKVNIRFRDPSIKSPGVFESVPDFGNDRPDGFWGWIDAGSDWIINKEMGGLVNPIAEGVHGRIDSFLMMINSNSVEIITSGIVLCGLGMMVGPMTGISSGKWFGWAFVIFWLGSIWRVLI